jgi:hypothetical protein
MKTTRLLFYSTGLNVILFGACGYLFIERPEATPVSPDIISQSAAPAVAPLAGTVAQAPFRWQQLESENYPTFIANLRAVGIPEPTLQAVIIAEVAADFDQQRQAIVAQAAPTESARLQKQDRLDQISREQSALVGRLLRKHPAGALAESAGPVSGNPAPLRDAKAVAGNIPVLPPAVLVPADPAKQFTDRQVAEWEKLQDDFVEAVGGPNQNPADPAYRARWISAQLANDQAFRAKFGTQAFLQQNIEAGRRSE